MHFQGIVAAFRERVAGVMTPPRDALPPFIHEDNTRLSEGFEELLAFSSLSPRALLVVHFDPVSSPEGTAQYRVFRAGELMRSFIYPAAPEYSAEDCKNVLTLVRNDLGADRPIYCMRCTGLHPPARPAEINRHYEPVLVEYGGLENHVDPPARAGDEKHDVLLPQSPLHRYVRYLI